MPSKPTYNSETLPGIGSLWIGGPLSRLERACIRSMLDWGHAVTIYSLGDVANVPDGVRLADAREIVGDRKPIPWTGRKRFSWEQSDPKTGSQALFSDLFRYHMLADTDLVWVDLDVLLLHPLRCLRNDDGAEYYIVPNGKGVATYMLRLPKNSVALRSLIEFCEDEYAVPPFLSLARRIWFRTFHVLGRPRHVSQLPWGTWGPKAVRWFLNQSGEMQYALQPDRFWHDRPHELFLPKAEFEARLPPDCSAVHLAGSVLRSYLQTKSVPPDSYINGILRKGE